MAGEVGGHEGPLAAPWAASLEALCDLLEGPHGAEVLALTASIRLAGEGAVARHLVRACAELERRRGLLLDVRRAARDPTGTATFAVRIRRRAARADGPG